MKKTIKKLKRYLFDLILFSLGIASAGFGLKGFLIPNHFIDGGVTGISLIISDLFNFPLSYLLIIINFPFIILGYKQVRGGFAVKSILAISALAATVHFVPFPLMTSDKLLVAVFGGFFLGTGIGLSIRGGAVLDGTEVLALFLSRKTSLRIGDTILIFNIIIFSAGAYFMSIEVALYAILTYIAASKAVDFVLRGIEGFTGVTIVSNESEKIRCMIIEKMGRGVTIYNGRGGFAKEGKELKSYSIIYTILTRLEVARLQREIDNIDPQAFIVMTSIKDTRGGMIKNVGIG